MTFAIDIDGVLCKYQGYDKFSKAEPYTQIIRHVQKLYEKGHQIIIYTSRWESDRETTEKWLLEKGVPYHVLVMKKPLADYYIDDRNISIEEWMKNEF